MTNQFKNQNTPSCTSGNEEKKRDNTKYLYNELLFILISTYDRLVYPVQLINARKTKQMHYPIGIPHLSYLFQWTHFLIWSAFFSREGEKNSGGHCPLGLPLATGLCTRSARWIPFWHVEHRQFFWILLNWYGNLQKLNNAIFYASVAIEVVFFWLK